MATEIICYVWRLSNIQTYVRTEGRGGDRRGIGGGEEGRRGGEEGERGRGERGSERERKEGGAGRSVRLSNGVDPILIVFFSFISLFSLFSLFVSLPSSLAGVFLLGRT